jgi:acyl-coenzyme A synthetase/AMP-(fatty) acid ligase/acyl carrier protein
MLESGSEALRGLSLRYCVTSGEALPSELARQFVRALPECRLLNLYGSSEVAADVMYDEVDSGDLVTIGRPIANTRVYVLDECLRVVPEGVPGGVYVCGEGVARGYLGRAEWTAERFVPHPYSETGGERLYWTGDVGRWLSDGRIEYVGRADAQVKVRGFRIELGEVEAALRQHPQVRECVVVAQRAENGETSLVAYVVAEEGAAPTTSELHHHVKEKLPEYMVPRFFITLGALPLTPSGKLDRRALPSPDQSRPALEDAYIAPGTLVEEVLCDLWSQVLKVERVGVRDNFFELGGHSLLATQLVSRMREAFRIEIPLRTIFEKKNIADLSLFLEERLLERVEEISEEEAEHLLKGDSYV